MDIRTLTRVPGFRFHPTDEELVGFFLKRKVLGKSFKLDVIAEVDLYKSEPWELPSFSLLRNGDLEWYFFTALDRKYGHGSRNNRATENGYWKTTGKDHLVHNNSRLVGARKTLVYHSGRAPLGLRTNWVMHEYRLEGEELAESGSSEVVFVLCKIFEKSGAGPKNGEQYGAPFVEEDWEDDDDKVLAVPKEENKNSASGSCNHAEVPAALPVPEKEEPDTEEFLEAELSRLLEAFEEDDGNISHPSNQTALSISNENYVEVDDFNPPIGVIGLDYYQKDEAADQDLLYHDVPTGYDISGTGEKQFVEMDDLLDPVDSNSTDLNFVNECLNDFDATDDYLEQYLASLDPVTAPVAKEELETVNSSLWSPKVLEEHVEGGGTLSKRKADFADGSKGNASHGSPGADRDGASWGNSFSKRLHSMVGSLSPPPAFASEDHFKGRVKFVGQSSGAPLAGSVHVEAGMIYVSGLTVTTNDPKHWHLDKNGDRFLSFAAEHLLSNSMTASEKARLGMLRGGFFLCFMWILLLAISCKVGCYVYAR